MPANQWKSRVDYFRNSLSRVGRRNSGSVFDTSLQTVQGTGEKCGGFVNAIFDINLNMVGLGSLPLGITPYVGAGAFAYQGVVGERGARIGWLVLISWAEEKVASSPDLWISPFAVQAEPEPPMSHPASAASGDELASLRRQPAPAWQPDGLVHR